MTLKKPQQPRAGGCGLPQRGPNCPKARIVNGTQSCYGQFPWQVRHWHCVICCKIYMTQCVKKVFHKQVCDKRLKNFLSIKLFASQK